MHKSWSKGFNKYTHPSVMKISQTMKLKKLDNFKKWRDKMKKLEYTSRRIDIPTGSRKDKNIKIPKWILKNKSFLIRYLRGLYEAEGSFCVHKPTCTYKFLFSNKNESLFNNVYRSLIVLGFHPNKSGYKV